MHPLPMLEKPAMRTCIPESPFVRAWLVNASNAEAAAVPERKLTCIPRYSPRTSTVRHARAAKLFSGLILDTSCGEPMENNKVLSRFAV
jgi:hypothetical protein